ncbi:MAG TPA: MarC family protein [Deferrisomatales bacterium]|nr:MarC family protein [Deferrisomatales bacterium]
MKTFWLCFVPLFIAVDVPGVLPIFLGLTEGLSREQVRKVTLQSTVTAVIVALLFLWIGQRVFALLGVTVADFMVAGGVLLFVISVSDLLTLQKRLRQVDPESLGPVPLGVPLIVGPAVLTSSILLANEYGLGWTALAIVTNIGLVALAFVLGDPIHRLLGTAGTKVLSKLSSLLLASIAVMIIRRGITALLGQ